MLLRVVVVIGSTGCIVPFGAPGSRIDGGYAMKGQSGMRAGAHVASSRHSADAKWDVGAGYTWSAAPEPTGDDPMPSSSRGLYVEGSYLHPLDKALRLTVGPGIAAMYEGSVFAPVAYVRTAVEVFNPVHASGSGDSKCGFGAGTWYGQLGLGVYVDVQKPLLDPGVSVLTGLSLRLPSFAGVVMQIPGCKDS